MIGVIQKGHCCFNHLDVKIRIFSGHRFFPLGTSRLASRYASIDAAKLLSDLSAIQPLEHPPRANLVAALRRHRKRIGMKWGADFLAICTRNSRASIDIPFEGSPLQTAQHLALAVPHPDLACGEG